MEILSRQRESARSAPAQFLILLMVLLIQAVGPCWGRTQDVVGCDGYPCVNFSFGANVSQNGSLFSRTFFNPPSLGAGLEPLGGGQLTVQCGQVEIELSQFQEREVERRWPFATVTARDPALEGVEIRVRAFAPLGYDDRVVSSLPVAMAEMRILNRAATTRKTKLHFYADTLLGPTPQEFTTQRARGLAADRVFAAWDRSADVTPNDRRVTATVRMSPGACCTRSLAIGRWDDNSPCAARIGSGQELAEHVFRYWDVLRDSTTRLERRLPSIGDDQVDSYLRWYATAGAAMTKLLKDGTVLTMGYHELNQRDSYWTSWMHLVLWPSLEKRMIEESAWGQRDDGKIPTTILPVIEREDDVDVNCFFILRALRYVRCHKDQEFGLKHLPSLKLAADWLATRDPENTGLPESTSYWFDWKDVPGMKQRKYSPYASMLYVAALQRLAEFCRDIGDLDAASTYTGRAERAAELLNRAIDQGGLYNGRHYEHVWRKPPQGPVKISEDQVVGIILNVVPPERARRVLDSLKPSISEWGCRETYPYFGPSFGYAPGDYHNGGVWPYLNHVHAWAMFTAGRRAEGIELLKLVGHADLEAHGDYIPHEYLHGQTGNQAGVPMQGWNAAIFGAVYFGAAEARSTP